MTLQTIISMTGIGVPLVMLVWQSFKQGAERGRISEKLDNIEKMQRDIIEAHKACRKERMHAESNLYDKYNTVNGEVKHLKGFMNGKGVLNVRLFSPQDFMSCRLPFARAPEFFISSSTSSYPTPQPQPAHTKQYTRCRFGNRAGNSIYRGTKMYFIRRAAIMRHMIPV